MYLFMFKLNTDYWFCNLVCLRPLYNFFYNTRSLSFLSSKEAASWLTDTCYALSFFPVRPVLPEDYKTCKQWVVAILYLHWYHHLLQTARRAERIHPRSFMPKATASNHAMCGWRSSRSKPAPPLLFMLLPHIAATFEKTSGNVLFCNTNNALLLRW